MRTAVPLTVFATALAFARQRPPMPALVCLLRLMATTPIHAHLDRRVRPFRPRSMPWTPAVRLRLLMVLGSGPAQMVSRRVSALFVACQSETALIKSVQL
jgi:hypothetical protein